ncbi:thiamine phosphate synthase [Pararhodospirillum oryzae]|uniref:Thiamine phosphate synthase n=1 Tax=Pararhodospirillum oryzae TaxID=478448 RepID=A0A512H611_9PROT|nr:thiamine phosphate synthase [Pararhodospirillum oryzae]GEO80820.1 thiamine phosphate synthase [Pararhodospirillum oryzae]
MIASLASQARRLARALRGKGSARRTPGAAQGRPVAAVLLSDPRRLPDPTACLDALPRGGLVVVRAHGLPAAEGVALAVRLGRRARRLGLRVALAASGPWPPLPRGLDGVHLPEGVARRVPLARVLLWRRAGAGRILCCAAHGAAGLARARALKASVVMLSPVFPTRSHPGAPGLGPLRAALLAAGGRKRPGPRVMALGGVNTRTARRLPPGALGGVAAIEGWAEGERA